MSDKLDRTLRIEIPPCYVGDTTGTATTWDELEGLSGWTVVPGTKALIWEGTIDLSGYARDYKTFYPVGGVVQQGAYTAEVGTGGGIIVYYCVSSVPLPSPADLMSQVLLLAGPGFIQFAGAAVDSQTWTATIFAQSELLVTNANIAPNPYGLQQILERHQSGSLAPTASDTLYVAKLALPLATTQSTLNIPASRVILPGSMEQEPELEYMMRLARSVELANQV